MVPQPAQTWASIKRHQYRTFYDVVDSSRSRYNVVTATDSPPTQVSVPSFGQNDERVTCVSCRFRYPSVRRFCPMCGVLASPDEANLENSSEANGGSPEISRKAPSNTGLRKPIPVVVSTVLLVCTVSYFAFRSRTAVKTPAAVPSVGSTLPQPNTPKAYASMYSSEKSLPEDADFHSAKPRPEKIAKTEDDDPAELWSRVRQGSSGAEVTLARLYLQGMAVARSCEQAHVLLLAASRKRNKAADRLLAGAYAHQCQ
jgi:hypothetical protein